MTGVNRWMATLFRPATPNGPCQPVTADSQNTEGSILRPARASSDEWIESTAQGPSLLRAWIASGGDDDGTTRLSFVAFRRLGPLPIENFGAAFSVAVG